MQRLRGVPCVPGIALGVAVCVRDGTVPAEPPPGLIQGFRRNAAGEPSTTFDVILVLPAAEPTVRDFPDWLRLVGVVSENVDRPIGRPWVPMVLGAAGVGDSVDGSGLMLVDGTRGVVVVDPTAETVAAFQADHERIAPRKRYYIDRIHQPARTLDNRTVRVSGLAWSVEDVAPAIDAGADAVCLISGLSLLHSGEEAQYQSGDISAVLSDMPGKPLTIVADPAAPDMAVLLEWAARSDITLVASGVQDAMPAREALARLAPAQEACMAGCRPCGEVRVGCLAQPGMPAPPDLMMGRAARVLVDPGPGADITHPDFIDWLGQLVRTANVMLVPVELMLHGDTGAGIDVAVSQRVAGIVTVPASVEAAKERIGQTDTEECRARLAEA